MTKHKLGDIVYITSDIYSHWSPKDIIKQAKKETPQKAIIAGFGSKKGNSQNHILCAILGGENAWQYHKNTIFKTKDEAIKHSEKEILEHLKRGHAITIQSIKGHVKTIKELHTSRDAFAKAITNYK